MNAAEQLAIIKQAKADQEALGASIQALKEAVGLPALDAALVQAHNAEVKARAALSEWWTLEQARHQTEGTPLPKLPKGLGFTGRDVIHVFDEALVPDECKRTTVVKSALKDGTPGTVTVLTYHARLARE